MDVRDFESAAEIIAYYNVFAFYCFVKDSYTLYCFIDFLAEYLLKCTLYIHVSHS